MIRKALVSLLVTAASAGAAASAADAWPGLNGDLAYGSNRSGSSADDIFVTPLDADAPLQLTSRTADDGQPAWSPDGLRIAFKAAQLGSNQLAVMRADGGGERLLTQTFNVSEGQPAWSPDGRQLLYRRTQENPLVQNADIWVLDISGSAAHPAEPVTRPVLQRVGDERYPSFSPDGRRIAFRGGDLVEANGDEEIYVMNADGTDVVALTHNQDFDSAPAWSPDGRRIAFERAPAASLSPSAGGEPEEKDIYVMNADGSHVRRLTTSPGKDEGPVWSPDGRQIAFSSDRDGQQELYVMNADGSGQRRLTSNPARDESPDWQPLRFDTRGHRACGDLSLAPGGASSIVAAHLACRDARLIASRWARTGGRRPRTSLRCTVSARPYDLEVVHCRAPKGRRPRADLGFVHRLPAR